MPTITPRPNLFIRLTHTGVHADGRPNTNAILIPDLDVGYESQDRKVPVYVPVGGFIDINASSRSMLSFEQGGIKKLTGAGLILSQMFYVPESYGASGLPLATDYPPGTFVWNTLDGAPYWSDGTVWKVGGGTPTSEAGGDLSGNYPDPMVAGIMGFQIAPIPPGNGDVLIFNANPSPPGTPPRWESAPITFSGGPPTGPAGGSLSGVYPNPTLSSVGTAGTYGSATKVPVVATNAEGRITNVTEALIQIDETQVAGLTGDLSDINDSLGTLNGGLTTANQNIADLQTGKVSTSRQVLAGDGLTGGGALTADVTIGMPNVGTAGTVGAAGQTLTLTTDAQGRVSGVTAQNISITSSQVSGLATDLSAKADKTTSISAGTGLAGGGDLSADRTIGMPAVGTAGTYGSASAVPVLTTDAQGRVSGVTGTSIQITESQVTGLTSELSGLASDISDLQTDVSTIQSSLTNYVPKTRQVLAGTGLTGGGSLDADVTLSMPVVGIADTYGAADTIGVFTTDAQGRVSSVSETPVQITTSQVTGLVNALDSKVDETVSVLAGSGLTGGGTLSGDVTIGMPAVGTPTTVGAASKTLTLTTDTQGRVSSVSEQDIQIEQSQVTGLTSALGDFVPKTTAVNTSNGLSGGGTLSADLTLSPVYGTTAGTITQGNDSRLSDARPPTGAAGGDLNGSTYPSPTISAIQGNLVALQSPNVGQVPIWTGSAWIPGSAPAGGSGGGGRVYFLNGNVNPQAPITGLLADTKQLSVTVQSAGSTFTSADLPTGGVYGEVIGFVTDVGNPDLPSLPAGVWDFNIWAAANVNQPSTTFFRIALYSYDGSTPTLIAKSGANYLYEPAIIKQYTLSMTVPQTTLAMTDRLYVVIEGSATTNGHQLTLSFGNTTPSHTHSTVPSVVGTGLVHVVNGTIQQEAAPVNLNAGATEISGILPLGNGGTGLSDTPDNGELLIGNGTGYTLNTLTAGTGVSVTNGPGSIQLDNTGLLSLSTTAPLATTGGQTPTLSLDASGVGAGSYGLADKVASFTVNDKGLVTLAADVPILITQDQVTNLTTVLSGKVPDTRQVLAGSGLTGGGALTSDVTVSMPDVGTASTYGSASSVAVITTDLQGRVSAASTTPIQIAETQVTNLVTDLAARVLTTDSRLSDARAPTGDAGGDLTGSTYPNPTVAKIQGTPVSAVPPAADQVLQFNGTQYVATTLQLSQAQITGLTTALDGKVPTTRNINTGTGLTGGGDLSADRTLSLTNTAVTAGSYTYASITVDQQGRLTAASNGTAPVTSVSGSAPIASTGGTTPTISLNASGVTIGSYGSTSQVGTFTVDTYGRLTAAANATIVVAPSQIQPAGTAGNVLVSNGTGFVSTSPSAFLQGVYQTVTGTAAGGMVVGQPVFITTSNGSQSAPAVNLAQANASATSLTIMGLTATPIANNGIGTVITKGILTSVDTSGFNQGDILYVSPTVAGGLTNSKPIPPNFVVPVGVVVVKNSTVGAIYVTTDYEATLQNLQDVVVTTPIENDWLKYDPATAHWINAPILKQPNTQISKLYSAGNQITAADFAGIVYFPIRVQGGANITLAASPIASLSNTVTDWGRMLWIHNVDTARSIIFPTGGNTWVDGAVNLTLPPKSMVKFVWTGLGSGGTWVQTDKVVTAG